VESCIEAHVCTAGVGVVWKEFALSSYKLHTTAMVGVLGVHQSIQNILATPAHLTCCEICK
jgi:hypothetical protein